MTKFLLTYPAALVIALSSTGCAPRVNNNIERVQNELILLKSNPIVSSRATVELDDASRAVLRAENNWNETRDSREAEHLSYLAEKRIEIARIKSNQQLAESEANRLSQARDTASMEARASMADSRALRSGAIIRDRELEIEALKSELRDLEASDSSRGLSLTLSDVLFENNRAELKPGAARKLIPLATYILNHPTDLITIEGHTDNTGTTASNLDLSSRRAEAVHAALVRYGVASGRIVTLGMGEQYPLISNNTEAGRLQNRRVDIIVSRGGSNQIIR